MFRILNFWIGMVLMHCFDSNNLIWVPNIADSKNRPNGKTNKRLPVALKQTYVSCTIKRPMFHLLQRPTEFLLLFRAKFWPNFPSIFPKCRVRVVWQTLHKRIRRLLRSSTSSTWSCSPGPEASGQAQGPYKKSFEDYHMYCECEPRLWLKFQIIRTHIRRGPSKYWKVDSSDFLWVLIFVFLILSSN